MNFTNLNKSFENKYTIHKSLLEEAELKSRKKTEARKNLLESIDRTLNEREWKLTIPGSFRNEIFNAGDEEDFEGVRNAIIDACSYVLEHIDESNFDLDDQEYVIEEFEDFIEELDYAEFEDEDEANYYLNELYDLLDNTDIFLGLREGLNERLVDGEYVPDNSVVVDLDGISYMLIKNTDGDNLYHFKELGCDDYNILKLSKKEVKDKLLKNGYSNDFIRVEILREGLSEEAGDEELDHEETFRQAIIDWFYDHEQAKSDIEKHVGVPVEDISLKGFLAWVAEHGGQLQADFEAFFNYDLDESLNESQNQYDEKIFDIWWECVDAGPHQDYVINDVIENFIEETGKTYFDDDLDLTISNLTNSEKRALLRKMQEAATDLLGESLKEGFYPEEPDEDFEYDMHLDEIEFERLSPYSYRIQNRKDLARALKKAKEHKYVDSWVEGNKLYLSGLDESLTEEKITAGDMPQEDIDIIQPLIDDFDSLEDANKDALSITWNFGRRNSDDKMTAGVDIYFLAKDSEENLQPYIKQVEDIILSDGYKFDDSLGYDENHWKEHMFGDGYHTQIIEIKDTNESLNESNFSNLDLKDTILETIDFIKDTHSFDSNKWGTDSWEELIEEIPFYSPAELFELADGLIIELNQSIKASENLSKNQSSDVDFVLTDIPEYEIEIELRDELKKVFDEYSKYFNESLNEDVNKIKVPAPYSRYFQIAADTTLEDEGWTYGEEVEEGGPHILALLEPKPEAMIDVYPILTDDPDFPVCEIEMGRLFPVEIPLSEDTVRQNGKWVNKGKEGTHGTFRTKKEADAQRKAMFAQGYKEELEEEKEFGDKSIKAQLALPENQEKLNAFLKPGSNWRESKQKFIDLIKSLDCTDANKKQAVFKINKVNNEGGFYSTVGTYLVGDKVIK